MDKTCYLKGFKANTVLVGLMRLLVPIEAYLLPEVFFSLGRSIEFLGFVKAQMVKSIEDSSHSGTKCMVQHTNDSQNYSTYQFWSICAV